MRFTDLLSEPVSYKSFKEFCESTNYKYLIQYYLSFLVSLIIQYFGAMVFFYPMGISAVPMYIRLYYPETFIITVILHTIFWLIILAVKRKTNQDLKDRANTYGVTDTPRADRNLSQTKYGLINVFAVLFIMFIYLAFLAPVLMPVSKFIDGAVT